MFQLIWQIYTAGIVIFFLVFLILEEKPFVPALTNAIFWPAGVYNIYIAGAWLGFWQVTDLSPQKRNLRIMAIALH